LGGLVIAGGLHLVTFEDVWWRQLTGTRSCRCDVELTGVFAVTQAMAVSIGWGVFLGELVVLAWLVARHNR
jgi:hypothetical protein